MKERLGTLEKYHITLPKLYTVNFSPRLSHRVLWSFPRVTVHLTKGNNPTFQGLLDTDSELILILVDPKHNCSLSVRVGVYGGQVINEALCWVCLTVGLVCP